MEWMPIETAPNDGTEVLVSNGKYVVACRWSEKAELGRFENGPAWQYFACDDPWYSIAFENPTHWMPLPEPPKN